MIVGCVWLTTGCEFVERSREISERGGGRKGGGEGCFEREEQLGAFFHEFWGFS